MNIFRPGLEDPPGKGLVTEGLVLKLQISCLDIGVDKELLEDCKLVVIEFSVIKPSLITKDIRKDLQSELMSEAVVDRVGRVVIQGVERSPGHPSEQQPTELDDGAVAKYLPEGLKVVKRDPGHDSQTAVFGHHYLIQQLKNCMH